jgi:hypothetical protein
LMSCLLSMLVGTIQLPGYIDVSDFVRFCKSVSTSPVKVDTKTDLVYGFKSLGGWCVAARAPLSYAGPSLGRINSVHRTS